MVRRGAGVVLGVEQPGEVKMGVGEVGMKLERAAEGGLRQRGLPLLRQQATQVGPGFDVVFVQLDRGVVAFAGGREVAASDRATRPARNGPRP